MRSKSNVASKITSAVVLAFFVWTFGGGRDIFAAVAASPGHRRASSDRESELTALERYGQVLRQIEAVSDGDYFGAKLEWEKAKELKAHPEKTAEVLRQLARELRVLEPEVDAEWKATEAHLKAHHLPHEILERHEEDRKAFKTKQKEFDQLLGDLEQTSDEKDASSPEVQQLAEFFNKDRPAEKHTIDRKNLPFRSPEAKVREPIADGQKLREYLEDQDQKADEERKNLPAGVGRTKEETASPSSESKSRVIARSAPADPTPEDLMETIDVQITQDMRAKAEELGKDPLAIYQWVRNHVRFIPTYGSIQGSQMTLETLRGNAFDISSLLIALLRASGIHARYVYGTIEVPMDKLMNWVGGVAKPETALNLLSQGGIPSVGLAGGGVIRSARMEHVWAEAYVDYVPSRGARHREGDAWIPLDASFKQYTYTQGMDFRNDVPFDAQGFVDQVLQGATVNEQGGWVQNLNHTAMSEQAAAYVDRITAYIDQTKPDATVGDLIGAQTIVAENHPFLLGTLPYKVRATADRYDTLPDALRHKFRYSLYRSSWARDVGAATWTYIESLPKLAGKKVTLSFIPATEADQKLLESYLPKPHADGSPIQPEEFPRSLPASIRVLSQLRVEGEVVASGGPFKLGDELAGFGGFTQYNLSGWDLTEDDSLIAGQVTAIGLSLQGMSPTPLQKLKERIEQTKTKLEASDLTGLTGEHLSGDLLTACVWGYFASLEVFGHTVKAQSDMIDLPGLSYGLFHAKVVPNRTFFGVTTSVRFPGLEMDIGHLRDLRIAKDNNRETPIRYNLMRGMHASAMEAAIPVKFFTDEAHPGKGISAATAIAKATQQGQKIFTITQATQTVALPQLLHSAGVMENIRNALAQGMEVTISQQPVSSGNWVGAGYIITDPNTGAGAYLIEGGVNGGFAEAMEWLTLTLACWVLAMFVFTLVMTGIVALLGMVVACNVAAFFILLESLYLIYQAHEIFPEDPILRGILINWAFLFIGIAIGFLLGTGFFTSLLIGLILGVLCAVLARHRYKVLYASNILGMGCIERIQICA